MLGVQKHDLDRQSTSSNYEANLRNILRYKEFFHSRSDGALRIACHRDSSNLTEGKHFTQIRSGQFLQLGPLQRHSFCSSGGPERTVEF